MNAISPLKSLGGKSASAESIIKMFPPHSSYENYVEPCCGACHVILNKPQWGHKEVINDLDNNIITFWSQMISNTEALKDIIHAYPYSRKLYYDFYHSLYGSRKHKVEADQTLTDLERAFRYYYVLRSNITGYIRNSPPGWTTIHSETFFNVTETFEMVQSRLAGVAVDNRDAIETVKRYDKFKSVFFYCDPPYVDVEHFYPASRNGFDHEGLAAVLNQSKHPVALSYYPHPEVDRLYPADKWNRVTWEQPKPSNVAANKGEVMMATEMLLTNYKVEKHRQVSLWEEVCQ